MMLCTTVCTFCVLVIFSVTVEVDCHGVNRTQSVYSSTSQQDMVGGDGDNCECGISKVKGPDTGTRIINGKPVRPPYKYPWQVALVRDEIQICGGSFISPTFVLTAAHCITEGEHYIQTRRLKIGYVGKSKDLGNFTPIQKFIPHPKYDPASGEFDFDLALLQLKKPVNCSGYVRPICLPDNVPALRAGSNITVSGWGYTKVGEVEGSKELLETDLEIRNCNKRSKKTHICAKRKGQGVCKGDSGGPLIATVKQKYYLFGVTSYALSSICETEFPQFFTNVKQNLEWIHQYVR